MRTLTIAVALTLVQAASAVGQYGSIYPSQPAPMRGAGSQRPGGWGYTPQARVWVDANQSYYQRGDRLRASFSVSTDAYVAVIHIDPDGRLDFLYPASPYDPQYVAGGRTYPLAYRSAADRGLLVRSGGGIGYLYVIASPTPLDYGYFQGRSSRGWDWTSAGQTVQGDPFWAMEQITRYLVPDWGYTPIAVDYYSYQVDGIHRYPNYACNGRYGQQLPSRYGQQQWGWGWGGGYTPSYYGSCDRLDYYLRDNPYYFDALRYRGDRRSAFRGYGSQQPDYRYKENPAQPGGSQTGRSLAPANGRDDSDGGRAQEPVQPTRRPTLERRDPPSEPSSQPARGVPPSSGTPTVRRAAPSGGGGSGGSAEPRRRAPD